MIVIIIIFALFLFYYYISLQYIHFVNCRTFFSCFDFDFDLVSRITFRSPSILPNSRVRVLSKYLARENCYFHLARAKYKEDSRTPVKLRFIISAPLSRSGIQRGISEAQYKQSEIQSNFSRPRNPFPA